MKFLNAHRILKNSLFSLVTKENRIVFICITVILIGFNATTYSQDIADHISKPKNGNTYVIAHRGAHQVFPENTLSAYQRAIEMGCDFVEIDLRKTKDGNYVSVHNERIDAYFEEQSGRVNSFLLSELKQMPLPKKGANNKDEYIPTFEQILELCKGKIGIYLDLKEPDIKAQVQIIKEFEMETDIVWYIPASFKKEIKELEKYCSECLVMPDVGDERNLMNVMEWVQPTIIASDMAHLTSTFANTVHRNGAKIFVDDDKSTKDEWRKMIAWGTDGIQTDKPETLIHYLKSGK